MAARLKVFVTSDGLTDFVVAATSKPKALEAWGSHQDLFKTGLARETDDAELVKAAEASPGEVLRRAAGTRGQLAKLKRAKETSPAQQPPKPKGPSEAALKKVADLERQIAAAQARHAAELARLEARLSAVRRALG